MEKLILSDKLDSLQRCLARIEERRADTLEALLADRDRQDILSLNLTRAVHSYRAIDWAIVHGITLDRLDDFRAFAAAMDGLLDE